MRKVLVLILPSVTVLPISWISKFEYGTIDHDWYGTLTNFGVFLGKPENRNIF